MHCSAHNRSRHGVPRQLCERASRVLYNPPQQRCESAASNYFTAIVTGTLCSPACESTIGTSLPGATPGGTTILIWYTVNCGARPANRTVALCPPMVAVTGFKVFAGGEPGPAFPALAGWSTVPRPVQ